ncbi:MAG TPA: diaminopimelate epimerase [Propionicimonas sp.]|nr:diaminopimelate epimerase [Propionicimonas sp.]
MRSLDIAKGHGTRNDFVLFVDRDGLISLTDAEVAHLCDRRAGIGADGILRAVWASQVREWDGDPELWFMDYRNADGSIAEMCGNGLRVFLRYLDEEGLIDSTTEVPIATRAGLRVGRFNSDGTISVTMGAVQRGAAVDINLAGRSWPAQSADVGNPHAVVVLDSAAELADLDLTEQPTWSPAGAFPRGVNVEFVVVEAPDALRLRVHERGVGETESCGTGVVAAAATLAPNRRCQVTVPGGVLQVDTTGSQAILTGPAVVAGRGSFALS